MGKSYKSPGTFSGNWEVQLAKPLDDRTIVDYITDLTALSTWRGQDGNYYHYNSMQVTCKEDHNVYIYTGATGSVVDVVSTDNWQVVGGSVTTLDTLSDLRTYLNTNECKVGKLVSVVNDSRYANNGIYEIYNTELGVKNYRKLGSGSGGSGIEHQFLELSEYEQLVADDLIDPNVLYLCFEPRNQINIPANTQSKVYDGVEPSIEGTDSYTIINPENLSANVGIYRFWASIIDPNLDEWTDGTDSDKPIDYTVTAMSVVKPLLSYTYTYNGQNKAPQGTQNYTITGGAAINIGEYTYVASLNNPNYIWNDSTTADITITVTIDRLSVPIPTLSQSAGYDGSLHKPESGQYYTVVGDAQSEVGDYQFTIHLNDTDNYQWSDGTTEDKIINYSIVQPTGRWTFGSEFPIVFVDPEEAGEEFTFGGTFPITFSTTTTFLFGDSFPITLS